MFAFEFSSDETSGLIIPLISAATSFFSHRSLSRDGDAFRNRSANYCSAQSVNRTDSYRFADTVVRIGFFVRRVIVALGLTGWPGTGSNRHRREISVNTIPVPSRQNPPQCMISARHQVERRHTWAELVGILRSNQRSGSNCVRIREIAIAPMHRPSGRPKQLRLLDPRLHRFAGLLIARRPIQLRRRRT